MSIRFSRIVLSALPLLGLAGCSGAPSATLPMAGHWQWGNSNPGYSLTLEQDKATCSGEADAILARIGQCNAVPPTDCSPLADHVARAMCEYSNSTTRNMCSVGRMSIPKAEVVDGCIAARGWKQAWVKSSG